MRRFILLYPHHHPTAQAVRSVHHPHAYSASVSRSNTATSFGADTSIGIGFSTAFTYCKTIKISR